MSVRQIAKALGLSPSAVSLALNHSPKIPDTTRERVMAEASRIGYRPKAKVRELMNQLRLSRTPSPQGGFAVISLYPEARPWQHSKHLTGIHDSMRQRAEELGYRLEPLWLRAPGMTYTRFRSVIDARGIQGLLCFGSPDVDEAFPPELDHYAIVTVGMSISTRLHRVTTHFHRDLTTALQKVSELGYRRPGLVLSEYEEKRSSFVYTSAYHGWCAHSYGNPSLMPVLRMTGVQEAPLLAWIRESKPDVIIVVQVYDLLQDLCDILQRNGLRIPLDLGVVAVSQILEGTGLSGVQQNQRLMGAWAVELLVARIMNQDFGIPKHPRIELVEGEWLPGRTLRRLT
jgi:DNA-binding LacI/PurR family transcriptional regulator